MVEAGITRVLVTGADGFIGAPLCALLESKGLQVVRATRENVGDLSEPLDWTPHLEGVDAVVHLAARVHVLRDNDSYPLAKFRQLNVDATTRLAQQAAAAGVKRFIFISTIGVLGIKTNGHPFTHQDEPRPCNDYALSKWEAERSLHEIARGSMMEVTVIRPPLVYGPGVKANFLMLMKAVASGWPLPLGAVKNRRDFVYVGNLTDAIYRCMVDARAWGQTFVIADGETRSTPQIMQAIAEQMHKRLLLLPVPEFLMLLGGKILGKEAMVHRIIDSLEVDAGHLRRTLGWVPPYSLEQGLAETVRWFIEVSD